MNQRIFSTRVLRRVLALGLTFGCDAAFALSCGSDQLVDHSFSGGGRWEMCLGVDDATGPVLSQVYYTSGTGVRRRVLKQANLSQLNVMLDDGSVRFDHVTTEGLGTPALRTLGSAQCPSGQLHSVDGQPVACAKVERQGYSWKYYSNQRQGERLTLSSLINLPSGNFLMRWSFADDGVIAPSIGHTGAIKYQGGDSRYGWLIGSNGAGSVFANSMTFEYIWRLDFAIGESATDDIVELMQVTPDATRAKKYLTVTPVTHEAAWPFAPLVKRSWRVRDANIVNADGHPVSYHLEPVESGMTYRGPSADAWTQNDLYVTTRKACERHGSENSGACASDVSGFANGEALAGKDVVLWYRTAFHRLPRHEDRDGFDIGWSTFHLIPRDWTATSPLY